MLFRTACLFAAAMLLTPDAGAAEPFYKGKRLTVLIGAASGGPTDIEGRLLAKYLGRHIEGQPNLLVLNKEGAGGVVGATFLGEVAPRDGTMLGYLSGTAWNFVNEPERWRVDLRGFDFVAFQSGTTVHFMRTDVAPGMKVPADIVKAQGLVAGGLAVESSKDLLIRVTLDMLGVPYRYVTGYRSSSTARLALQRGEIHLHSETTPAFFSVVEPSLVKPGAVIPLYYDGNHDGDRFSVPNVMESYPLPQFQEFYRSVKGGLPTGRLWDAYRTNLAVDSAMLRTVVMPPGAPAAAVDALRTALARLNTDKDYAEEAMKAMQFVPHYETGDDINTRVRRALTVPPEIRSFVLEYMKGGK